MPHPYNEEEVLDVSSFYHTFFSEVNVKSDSVLVYTNEDFNTSEWIRCISNLFADIRVTVSNYGGDILRCMFCKKGEENKKPIKGWQNSEEWKGFKICERLVKSRVPLENVVLCNVKKEEDLKNLEDLRAFFVEKYDCNNVLLDNSLNPAECKNMPSVLNKSAKVRTCRLEPAYLTNVALYLPEGGVKKNFECVSKHASIAFKNVRRTEMQPFLETENIDNIFPNLQTVFLNLRELMHICDDVKLQTNFINKLEANGIERIVITDNKGGAYVRGPVARISVELDNIINYFRNKEIKSLSVCNDSEIERLAFQKAVELGAPLKHLYLSSSLAGNFIKWILNTFTKEQRKSIISSKETTIVLDRYNENLANYIKGTLNPSAVVWYDITKCDPWCETREEALFYRKKSKFLDAISSKNVPSDLSDQVFKRIEVEHATKDEIDKEFGKTIPEVSILFGKDDIIYEPKNFLEI